MRVERVKLKKKLVLNDDGVTVNKLTQGIEREKNDDNEQSNYRARKILFVGLISRCCVRLRSTYMLD